MRIIFLFAVFVIVQSPSQSLADGVNKTIDVADGYPLEEHFATTPDGYILKLFRISGSPQSPPAPGKPVVFFMHALLSSASDWVVQGANRSLPYLLADIGYDVWLGNARGNTYSRAHVSLSPEEKEFWKFNLQEIGVIDLPKMIDFVLNETKKEKLHYIGHSQGTTTFFIMASERPEYNDKIITMQAFAPSAFLGRQFSPLIRILSLLSPAIEFLFNAFGYNEVLPTDDFLISQGKKFCNGSPFSTIICSSILFSIVGFDSEQLEPALLPKILANTPAGSSANQLLHYLQFVSSGKFKKYDFGPMQNFKRYGTFVPPDYDLKRVTAPVYLYYGQNDWLVAEKDVAMLVAKLGNVILSQKVPFEKFNHLDFTYAKDAKTLVYKNAIKVIVDRS